MSKGNDRNSHGLLNMVDTAFHCLDQHLLLFSIRDDSMTTLINEFFLQFFTDFVFMWANFRCVQSFILASGH